MLISIFLTEIGIVICVIPVLQNANEPIDVTELGISIYFKELHPENALFPILIIEEGIITFSNDMQPSKVSSSISVIDDGIVISFNFLHSLKDPSSILVTDDGIIIVFIFEKIFVFLIILTFEFKFNCVNEGQLSKALYEILVVYGFISISERFWQFLKQLFLILLTEEGIEICSNDEL